MKALFSDLLNGFALSDVPLFLIQIASAAILGLLAGLFSKSDEKIYSSALFSSLFAVLTALVKYSFPLSIMVLVLAVLFSVRFMRFWKDDAAFILYLASAVAGICCGAGYVILTFLSFILIVLPLLWLQKRS
ncbi:MAG: hypothetical protein K1X56_00580 [Flavobacteriales bacterium]|nr:hypothetical protein [Flavobacteriales bacterium]